MEGFGIGLQCSSMQNESQTYANVSFITSTRRNTPSFYNLNIHKRERNSFVVTLIPGILSLPPQGKLKMGHDFQWGPQQQMAEKKGEESYLFFLVLLWMF